VTLPDTSCQSAVGVGADDIPHAYYTANGVVTATNDACPDHYSGELGFGIGGVWLFSREGQSPNGGDGVVVCYGSTDPTAGLTNPPADATLVDLVVNFVLSLLGLAPGGTANCTIPPGPNTWTAPGTLADYAGADGAVVLFIQSNVRADAGHLGTGTTGAVWTS